MLTHKIKVTDRGFLPAASPGGRAWITTENNIVTVVLKRAAIYVFADTGRFLCNQQPTQVGVTGQT
jgi:hypothetical protein